MSCNKILEALKETKFPDIKIVTKDDDRSTYDQARRIANLRFDLFPCAIAYCSDHEQVASFLSWCVDHKFPFRVRSGGHQHLGMCSADDSIIIDITGIDQIEYLDNGRQAWIPAGKTNGDVYLELKDKDLIFAGGGCGNVRVGGLVQGGGWSPSGSTFGMACDTVSAARIILANGQYVTAKAGNEYENLFWAIRGGGGGNFGIATHFLMDLFPLDETQKTFSLRWEAKYMEAITTQWMELVSDPNTSDKLTINCRLSVCDEITINKAPVALSGIYYGEQSKLDGYLNLFKKIGPPLVQPEGFLEKKSFDRLAHLKIGRLVQTSNAPVSTCDGPHPHVVASLFPATRDFKLLAQLVANRILNTTESEAVNQYISLMHMGGKIATLDPAATAFPYRNKYFVMQLQEWWSDPADPRQQEYLDWMAAYLEELRYPNSAAPMTEGAFINFPQPNFEGLDKEQLLEMYYAGNLPRLIDVKTEFDRDNAFDFPLSIPVS